LGLKDLYKDGVQKVGFSYLDSSASQELPVWGYGLRYKYGIFQQLISPDGEQLEVRPLKMAETFLNDTLSGPRPVVGQPNYQDSTSLMMSVFTVTPRE